MLILHSKKLLWKCTWKCLFFNIETYSLIRIHKCDFFIKVKKNLKAVQLVAFQMSYRILVVVIKTFMRVASLSEATIIKLVLRSALVSCTVMSAWSEDLRDHFVLHKDQHFLQIFCSDSDKTLSYHCNVLILGLFDPVWTITVCVVGDRSKDGGA